MEEKSFWVWWKKYGEHLVAPLILIALLILGFQLYQDNQLKKQININCGWGEEDYRCFCEKSKYWEIYNKANQDSFGSQLNLSVDFINDSEYI